RRGCPGGIAWARLPPQGARHGPLPVFRVDGGEIQRTPDLSRMRHFRAPSSGKSFALRTIFHPQRAAVKETCRACRPRLRQLPVRPQAPGRADLSPFQQRGNCNVPSRFRAAVNALQVSSSRDESSLPRRRGRAQARQQVREAQALWQKPSLYVLTPEWTLVTGIYSPWRNISIHHVFPPSGGRPWPSILKFPSGICPNFTI